MFSTLVNTKADEDKNSLCVGGAGDRKTMITSLD